MAVLKTEPASVARRRLPAITVAIVLVLSACAGTSTPPPATGSSPGVSLAATPSESASPAAPAPSSSTSSPVAPSGPAATPSEAGPSLVTPPSVTPRPTEAPVMASGPWAPAGKVAVSREGMHALPLPDGRVLAVGNDASLDWSSVRDDSAAATIWDASSSTWSPTAGLNRPRGHFAASVLRDGRVLVAGGVDRGAPDGGNDPSFACRGRNATSFSSAYLFDPAAGSWSRAAPMGTARADPSMVTLPDGRVLVVGGFYIVGGTASVPPDATLAAYRPGETGSGPRSDVAPSFTVPPLATAEVFDPGTGTWSATGPMHYARYGAAATVLADGRVLVVGSSQGIWIGQGSEVMTTGPALTSAEIYDPATGRFSLTGSLPNGNRLPQPEWAQAGSLVALPDGGALLVANDLEWKHGGWDVRSFRFDAATGSWREVGTAFVATWHGGDVSETPGVGGRRDALVASLPAGRVLVAGGMQWDGFVSVRSASIYDPATDRWTSLPPMPVARAGGAAVTLSDGSVLLAGGYADQRGAVALCNEPLGLASAVRFVPTP